MRPPAFAFACVAPSPLPTECATSHGRLILAFDSIGYKRRDEVPPPRKPVRRDVSPAARVWSWIMVAMLIAAFVLPFSLAAAVDLVQYLRR